MSIWQLTSTSDICSFILILPRFSFNLVSPSSSYSRCFLSLQDNPLSDTSSPANFTRAYLTVWYLVIPRVDFEFEFITCPFHEARTQLTQFFTEFRKRSVSNHSYRTRKIRHRRSTSCFWTFLFHQMDFQQAELLITEHPALNISSLHVGSLQASTMISWSLKVLRGNLVSDSLARSRVMDVKLSAVYQVAVPTVVMMLLLDSLSHLSSIQRRDIEYKGVICNASILGSKRQDCCREARRNSRVLRSTLLAYTVNDLT